MMPVTVYQRNKQQVNPRNMILFRKIILLTREGVLQVNGQFPDANKTLLENLMEGHSFVVDLTQLNAEYRHKLKTWLLDPHFNECQYTYWERYINNDYRGFTVEVPLSWWGRLINWLIGGVETAFWPLETKEVSHPYQLRGLTLQMGKQGWLFHLNVRNYNGNTTDSNDFLSNLEQARNSRRILLTPQIVNKIMVVKEVDDRILAELNEAHPLSIKVEPKHRQFRQTAMAEFRKTELIESLLSWYVKIWAKSKQFLLFLLKVLRIRHVNKVTINRATNKQQTEPVAQTKHVLYEKDGLKITKQGDVFQVRENWPGYSNLICAGGGAKIFALVGAYKACKEKGLSFKSFAGSSAGAIMSILAYLNYSPDQIALFFADFNRDVLLYNEWDRQGYSKTTALKAGLDYMIGQKIVEIIDRYDIDKTENGREFLNNHVFSQGKITFRSLEKLRKHFPDCGLGEKLIITASNLQEQRTTYFSLATTPDVEISHAGEMSASLPLLFKPPIFNGIPHSDGGLTSNFPSEVFVGHDQAFLSSRYGYSIESLGFCFDNGSEDNLLTRFRQQVYRESTFANWFYKKITGIHDVANAWEWDRIKLVQQSFTTVLLHADVSSTKFTVSADKQKALSEKGYEETKRHLSYLYKKQKSTGYYMPCQMMYEFFPSIESILVQCCYRQNKSLFDNLLPTARQYGLSDERIQLLSRRFDDSPHQGPMNDSGTPIQKHKHNASISRSLSNLLISTRYVDSMRLFINIYPLFLIIKRPMFEMEKDYKIFCQARHGMSINNPFYAINYIKTLSGKCHLIVFLLGACLETYTRENLVEICSTLSHLSEAITQKELAILETGYLVKRSSINQDCSIQMLFEAVRLKQYDAIINLNAKEIIVSESIIDSLDKIEKVTI